MTDSPVTAHTVLEIDSRKRISLGKLGDIAPRYLASMHADGTITLEPAVVMSRQEADALLKSRPRISPAEAKLREQHPELFNDHDLTAEADLMALGVVER